MQEDSSPAEKTHLQDHGPVDPVHEDRARMTVRQAQLVKELISLKEVAINELLEKRQTVNDASARKDLDEQLRLLGFSTPGDQKKHTRNMKSCSACHKPGHNARTCPDRKKTGKGS
jgi:hypothetical protein